MQRKKIVSYSLLGILGLSTILPLALTQNSGSSTPKMLPTILQNSYNARPTTLPYSIAVASSNGSYTKQCEMNDYTEAKNFANTLYDELKDSNSNDVPVVIDTYGFSVYTPYGMGELVTITSGKLVTTTTKNTYVYSSSSLLSSQQKNYINHRFLHEVPLLEDTSKAEKIIYSGDIGWVDKEGATRDLLILPMNQVKNLSYYYQKNGELYHYMNQEVTETKSDGYSLSLGLAPNFMTTNVPYYSVDGIYYYLNINTLISDVTQSSHAHAVNASTPYYSYFQYLPLRSETQISAQELDNYINKYSPTSSVLRGTGEAFITAQEKYGINALIMLSIGINESAFGTSEIARTKNNLFGLDAADQTPGESASYFPSVEACIDDFAQDYLAIYYASPRHYLYRGGFLGNKYRGVNVNYASDPFWSEKALQYMYRIDKYVTTELRKGSYPANSVDYQYYTLGIYKKDNVVYQSPSTLSTPYYHIVKNVAKGSSFYDTSVIIYQQYLFNHYGIQWMSIVPEIEQSVTLKYFGDYTLGIPAYASNDGVTIISKGKSSSIPLLTHVCDPLDYYTEKSPSLLYSPGWNTLSNPLFGGGSLQSTTTKGSKVTFKFTGTGFQWKGFKDTTQGIASITIDGMKYSVDLYSSIPKYHQTLYSKNGLTYGNHTVSIAVSGSKNKNSSGYGISVEGISILKGTMSTVQNTASEIKQLSNWNTLNDVSYSGGSITYSSTVGDQIVYAFTGDEVQWISDTTPYRGIAKVTLDGISEYVDCYSKNMQYQKTVYHKKGLAPGKHTLTIEVTGKKNEKALASIIALDSFLVGNEKSSIYNDNNSKLLYSGTWTSKDNTSAISGTLKVSNKAKSKVSFSFTGEQISLIGQLLPTGGKAKVTIDGVSSYIDTYNPTIKNREVVFYKDGLTNTTHTITIEVLGSNSVNSLGTDVIVDGFVVAP